MLPLLLAELTAVPPPPEPGDPYGVWIARATLAVSWVPASDEASLLAVDRYNLGVRNQVSADAAFRLGTSPWIGLGPFFSHAFGSWKGPRGDLWESSWALGVAAPIVLVGVHGASLAFTPRLGVGAVTLDFGGSSKEHAAPLVGADLTLLFFGNHVGATAGWWWGPTSRMGDLGGTYDMGGIFVGLTGALHD